VFSKVEHRAYKSHRFFSNTKRVTSIILERGCEFLEHAASRWLAIYLCIFIYPESTKHRWQSHTANRTVRPRKWQKQSWWWWCCCTNNGRHSGHRRRWWQSKEMESQGPVHSPSRQRPVSNNNM